jgi:hypothetical protein
MKTYHKIPTVYQRDPLTNYRTLLPRVFATPEIEYLANCQWEWTEKVDGTNIRVMFDGERITFGGKSDNAQLPTKLLTRLEERFLPQYDRIKEAFPEGVCLYGEGYGPKIQKGGGMYRDDQDIVIFDVKIGPWWLERKDVEQIAEDLGLDTVPVRGRGVLSEMETFVRNGFGSAWGTFPAEGVVARPLIGLAARNGQRIITKLKAKDFPVD